MAVDESSKTLFEETLNTTAFSVDSLQIGDSTRSLLSPLYDKRPEFDPKQSLQAKTLVENASRNMSSDSVCSQNDDSYTSEYDASESESNEKRRPKAKDISPSETSEFSFSTSSLTPKTQPSKHINMENESSLSPWEKWLLNKVIQDEKHKKVKQRERLDKKQVARKKIDEKMETDKRVKENRSKWLKLKRNEEKIKNEIALRIKEQEIRKTEDEQAKIRVKAEESFEKWFKAKEKERKDKMKNKKMNEKNKKERDFERRNQSEEAYKIWFEKSKCIPKSKSNHFGYLEGKITGYYDWTCYPQPSYTNPQPWVSPKVKVQRQSKIKMQNPSPPLLFKEVEEREKKLKYCKKTAT